MCGYVLATCLPPPQPSPSIILLVTIEKSILIYGVIISTGYGVVTLEGLLIAFISEVFTTQSFSIGLVVNLYQNDTMNLLIGALLLNPRNPLDQGSTVHALSSLATLILGDCTIASILDPVGNLILIQVESICSILGP